MVGRKKKPSVVLDLNSVPFREIFGAATVRKTKTFQVMMLQNPHGKTRNLKESRCFFGGFPSNAGHLIRGLDILNNLPKDQASWADQTKVESFKKVHSTDSYERGPLKKRYSSWNPCRTMRKLQLTNRITIHCQESCELRMLSLKIPFKNAVDGLMMDCDGLSNPDLRGVGILGIDSTDCKCW